MADMRTLIMCSLMAVVLAPVVSAQEVLVTLPGSTASQGFTVKTSTASTLGTIRGNGSFAVGRTASATGLASSALGYSVTSTGIAATALGLYTNAASYGVLAIGRYNVGDGTAGSWSSLDPIFEVGIGASATARENAFTILKNGNVGIGTAHPSYPLDVTGHVHFRDEVATEDAFWAKFGTSFYKLTKDGTNAEWTTSDARLKRDVAPLGGALARVMQLRPVTYHWNDAGLSYLTRDIETNMRSASGTDADNRAVWNAERTARSTELAHAQIGLIAQELERVFPEWVHDDAGVKKIDTRELVVVLVAAMRELAQRNAAELDALREEVRILRSALQREAPEPVHVHATNK
jgi:hypothetical protein